jgi:hypothetical protein
VSDPVTYTAVLSIGERTVLFVTGLLAAERRPRGSRPRRRALGSYRQAVLVLRWFLDGTQLAQLAADNQIARSTGLRVSARGRRCPRRGRAQTDPIRLETVRFRSLATTTTVQAQ